MNKLSIKTLGNKISGYLKILWSRLTTIKKVVLVPALISLFSIIIIELNNICFFGSVLAQIYLKICYSYFSAFIFYVLVVHLQKEDRRIKTYLLINNNVGDMSLYLRYFLEDFFKLKSGDKTLIQWDKLQEYGKKDYVDKLNQIGNSKPQNTLYNEDFTNYYGYLFSCAEKIKNRALEIVFLEETLSNDFLDYLVKIINYSNKVLDFKNSTQNDLGFLGSNLKDLSSCIQKIERVLFSDYKKYDPEYHARYRREGI